LGADLSRVRIHADATSNQLSRSIQAKAFTHGNDIHFRAGEYDPTSSQGKHLLAHELTHTIQQTGGKQANRVQPRLQVGAANDRFEQEADRVADGHSRHQGGAMGKVQSAVVPTIQRMMNFQPQELQGDLSTGAKRASKFGITSAFRKIQTTLDRYWAAKGNLQVQANLLQVLAKLTEKYLNEHKDNVAKLGSNADKKVKSVARLRLAIIIELPKLEQRMKDRAFIEGIKNNESTLKVNTQIDQMGGGKRIAHNRKYNTAHVADNDQQVVGDTGWGRVHQYGKSDPSGEKEFQAYKRYADAGVTTADRIAISIYTGGDFDVMNPAIANNFEWYHNVLKQEKDNNDRSGKSVEFTRFKHHNPHTDIDWVKKSFEHHRQVSEVTASALNKLPNWEHKGRQLYRGETVSDSQAATMATGYVRQFASFVSTSRDRARAEHFAANNVTKERPWRVIYVVTESKTGKDVEELSAIKGEFETLFMPNTEFEVTKVLNRDPAKKYLEVRVRQK
jgi:hypothetical protein